MLAPVTFFKAMSLQPVPTEDSSKEARWINIGQNRLDSAQPFPLGENPRSSGK
jgi:hypothetical protein